MTSIAFIVFIMCYLLAPTWPITWVALALLIVALARESFQIAQSAGRL